MILFTLYLVSLLALIYFNACFGLFKDDRVTKKQLTLLFFLKSMAVPVFYVAYKKMYGGIELFDAGKFFHDSVVINHYAYSDFFSYLKLLFGLQNDQPGSHDYINCLVNTVNWDNGTIKDYLYNDNRVLIRIHSLINFLAFDSYFVHALFNCFLSFIGIFFLFKSFKEFFENKEKWVVIILCLFPALWFYTGALLKEGITLFFLGTTIHVVKKNIYSGFNLNSVAVLLLLVFLDCLLKPYLLLFSSFCFTIFFVLDRSKKIKRKILTFLLVLTTSTLVLNFVSLCLKDRSLLQAASKHQRIFVGVAKGGIFLTDYKKFVRLEFDTALVSKRYGNDSLYNIKRNAPFMYWEGEAINDTLYCAANIDTLTVYKLVYKIAKSNSNIDPVVYSRNIFITTAASLYYSLFHPLFFNVQSFIQMIASFENLIIIFALLIIFISCFKSDRSTFFPFTLIFICLSVCILISIAAPNIGAIFRYRSPVVVLILLSALYYLNSKKSEPRA